MIKHKLTFIILMHLTQISFSQLKYESSEQFPYGRPNPESEKELIDFAPMIGSCDCFSTERVDENTWSEEEKIIWNFKYIMDGRAIQDETYKKDQKYSGSIRQFNTDSSKWYVIYYSSNKTPPSNQLWTGKKVEDKIILYQPQKAPNGMEGYSRLTFYDIDDNGFKWIEEWVNEDESFVYPTWKIKCTKNISLQAETNHSTILFKVPIAGGLTQVSGKFNSFSIDFNYKSRDIMKSNVKVEIDINSINTGIIDRDEHLLTEDFFDAKKFPKASFVSDSIFYTQNGYIAIGDLTIHGITKKIQIPFNLTGIDGNYTLGFKSTFTIKKSDFEVGSNFKHTTEDNFVGDEITMEIFFWSKKKK